jgi:hypothetical protein
VRTEGSVRTMVEETKGAIGPLSCVGLKPAGIRRKGHMGKYVCMSKPACRRSSPRWVIIGVSYLAANQDRSVQLTNLAVDPRHLWRCVQENAWASGLSNRLQTQKLYWAVD